MGLMLSAFLRYLRRKEIAEYRASPEGRLLQANNACGALHGYPSGESFRQSIACIKNEIYVRPEKRDKIVKQLMEKSFVNDVAFEAYRKDGSKIWLNANMRVSRDPIGGQFYFEGKIENCSETKSLREKVTELDAAANSYEQLISCLSDSLEPIGFAMPEDFRSQFSLLLQTLQGGLLNLCSIDPRDALAKEDVQHFLHDVRSPLMAIQVVAAMSKEIPEDRQIILNRSLLILKELIEKLASTSPMASSHLPPSLPKLEKVILADLISDIVKDKAVELQQHSALSIAFRNQPSIDSCQALLEPLEFRRVLSNLLNNSVEATSYSGRVAVTLKREDNRLTLLVEDAGKGIPAEIRRRLFRKGATNGKSKGSGLGLYHARRIVAQWGGSVDVFSIPGTGTTVRLILPLLNP